MNRAHWPTKENKQKNTIFLIFLVHGKIASDGPKWGQEDFFPTNPDLADNLGRTDLNFENFYFFDVLDPKFPDIQVPNFQKSDLGRAWAGRAGEPFGWAL